MPKGTKVGRWLALCAMPMLLSGCGDQWGWYVVNPADTRGQQNLRFLADGFLATVQISVGATLVAVALGLAVAVCGLAKWRPLRALNRIWVELFRATPPLVVILWVFLRPARCAGRPLRDLLGGAAGHRGVRQRLPGRDFPWRH